MSSANRYPIEYGELLTYRYAHGRSEVPTTARMLLGGALYVALLGVLVVASVIGGLAFSPARAGPVAVASPMEGPWCNQTRSNGTLCSMAAPKEQIASQTTTPRGRFDSAAGIVAALRIDQRSR